LIIGLDRSAIGTLVERSTRFTMLLHLPRIEGYGVEPRVHNDPALAGRGAEAVRDAIAATIATLLEHARTAGAAAYVRGDRRRRDRCPDVRRGSAARRRCGADRNRDHDRGRLPDAIAMVLLGDGIRPGWWLPAIAGLVVPMSG
jgi:hypothetical protein